MTLKYCCKCGNSDWGYWTSSSSRKTHRYCRACRRKRAANYTQQKKINGGSHTEREWREKLAKYDTCPMCKIPWTKIPPRPDRRYKYVWTKDHIVPITTGGHSGIDNIQPLCYRCNSSKSNREMVSLPNTIYATITPKIYELQLPDNCSS